MANSFEKEAHRALAISGPDMHSQQQDQSLLDRQQSNNEPASVENSVMEEYSEKPPPPPPRRFYKQKKYWIICSIITVIIVVVVVLLIIYVFFPMIAQALMNQSGIGVDSSDITFNPPDNLNKRDGEQLNMNSSFYMSMTSSMSNTGPFAADLKFHNPINVYYNDTLLGNITLPDSNIAGGKGTLQADTPFLIQNTTFFAAFAREMLANDEFKWKLKGKLDITALTRTATVQLDKEVTIPGMGGFPEVSIQSFELPGDDPNGGILVELGTILNSPSPVGVQLGTIKMAIGYDGVDLGEVTAEGINLAKGNNSILLKGTLQPQSDPANLEKVGKLFSNYVSGKMSQTTAVGVSAAPDGTNSIGWLSEGFQSVRLNVGLGVDKPLDIIKSVSMGYLDLAFSADQPYAPVLSAPEINAGFQIPFGFSLDITDVKQDLQMANNETGSFATISAPFVPAQSNQESGELKFAMNNDTIQAIGGQEPAFNDYTYALTAQESYTFQIKGEATTKTVTPIGNITLGGITLDVPTSLKGLQFLNSTPTIINSLDVTGGETDHMNLAINLSMSNPSDFSIYTGDVSFDMKADNTKIGTVTLSQLKLNRGDNAIVATAAFDPKSSTVGQNLLSTFVMGSDNNVNVAGNENSTPIKSLIGGLSVISIDSTLPGLKDPLIQGSKLTVLNDTLDTGIVNVQVSIANPFTAGLSITSVKSAVTYSGMPVGNINQDVSGNPINIPGHSTVQSTPLDMTMNLEPGAVALLLRDLAVKKNLDTRPLDALLTMGGFSIQGQEEISADPSLFDGFDISKFVMEAMSVLAVDLQLESGLTIGQYVNTLQFAQSNVATATDETVTKLIPVVGQPIVQQIVDGSDLAFETITLSEPTNSGFKVQMVGSISNTGPMAASISFAQPLTISWEGRELGKVSMDTINTQPNVGATFNVSGEFSIADANYMGDFAEFMINNDEFVWDINSIEGVNVDAIGYLFTNINMTKQVTLGGAKGFKDCVTIHSFDLPANDPAGGISLTLDVTIQNPSQVGFLLAGAGFESFFKDIQIGVLASDGAASFPPKGSSDMTMKGRLIKQDSQEGIDAITEVFANFLSAQNSTLTVKGTSGSGPQGQVSWLTKGFQSLSIENVTLPGPEVAPELIPSITLKDMELDFTAADYAPIMGSNLVNAQLKNPFGFPLGVSSLNMDVEASYQNNRAAHMDVPDVPSTTDANGMITTAFSGVPFEVYDDAHKVFNAFTKALTESSNVTFGMSGMANSIAETAVGQLKLTNISYDVSSSLSGFNNFDGKTTILKQAVTGGTPEYIEITLTVAFNNPSNITITIGAIQFESIMNEHQTSVGTVKLQDVVIKPGNNTFDCIMEMKSSKKEYVDQMVSIYMTNSLAPLTISGTQDSTKIASIQDALSTVRLGTAMQGIVSNLVERADVEAKAAVVLTKKAKTWVTLNNPLNTPYTIQKVSVEIENENDGKPYAMGTIDYELPNPITVNPGEQKRSDEWPVDVDANALQLLGLIGNGEISISLRQNVTVQVGDTDGGYASYFYYYQNNVPCGLDIKLLGISLPDDEDFKKDDNSTSSSVEQAASSAAPAA
ncbi:hypothetical protein BDB00DRAFT_823642 [Zychaea mexicana]|uniref:uncharacterized protein n=1 Tax=Zychaea mexicana TaxID=64656 RepID=UPI0022FE5AA7|nr:uncharacterized protein BDB00DRAFT_823642 [Zychaea mexicana]KAI9493349.1 hypothetical protein BDB00DRAFT_823642 [Zychaea mexicana]